MAASSSDPLCKACRQNDRNPSYAWCDACIRKSKELQSACVAIDSLDASRPASLREMIFGRRPRYQT